MRGGVALGVMLDADADEIEDQRGLEESGAAEAGVKAGDVILAFDGEEVDLREDLFELLEKRGAGERVKLRLRRGGGGGRAGGGVDAAEPVV